MRVLKTWAGAAFSVALSVGTPAVCAPARPAPAPPAPATPAKPVLCMLYLDALVGGGAEAKTASLKRGLYGQAHDLTKAVYHDRACAALVDGTQVLAPGSTLNITDEIRQRLDAAAEPTPPSDPAPAGPPSFRALFADLNVAHGGEPILVGACGLDGVVILQRSKTVTYIDQRIAALKDQATAEVAAAGVPIQAEADALLQGQGKMSKAQYDARSAALRERMKAQRALMSDRQSQIRGLEGDAFGRFQTQLNTALETQIAAHHCDPLVDLKALGPFPPERDMTTPVLQALDAQFVAFPIELPAVAAATAN